MSQESYNRGFEKIARAHGVDPVALIGFHKQAFSLGELKSKLEGFARKGYGMARDAWHSVPHEYKPLVGAAVGAGGGALGGAALGSLTGLGAGRGALVGAGLGGVGGGLYGANSMAKNLKSDSAKALKGKDKEMADAAAAHLAALQGKDKEMADLKGQHAEALAALRGKHKDELASQAKTLAEARAKLDAMTHKYTPEELGKMTKEQRNALLAGIRAAQSDLTSSSDTIGDVNLRNHFARMGFEPAVIDRIMESEGAAGRARAQIEASALREAARSSDAATQAKIQKLMAEIEALRSRGKSNLLPKVYKSK